MECDNKHSSMAVEQFNLQREEDDLFISNRSRYCMDEVRMCRITGEKTINQLKIE
jgi:hypothetical protein